MPAETARSERRNGRRPFRIAAVGDLHYGGADARGSLAPLFEVVNRDADVFVLLGDLSSPAKARLIALPRPPATQATLAANDCGMAAGSARAACAAKKGQPALVVAGQ